MPAPEEDEQGVDEIGPDDPDYDLSDEHGYAWEPRESRAMAGRIVLVAVSILVVIALVLPALLLIARR